MVSHATCKAEPGCTLSFETRENQVFHASRLTTVFASAALAALVACPAPQAGDQTQEVVKPSEPEKPKAPEPQDITLNEFDKIDLQGDVFKPEGFGNPGMRKEEPKKKTTEAKLRRRFNKAQGAKKVQDAKVLASMIWTASRAEADKAKKKTMREEARQLLLQAHTAANADIDAAFLQMVFTAQVWAKDEAGALAAGAELQTRFADSGPTKALAPWIAYYQLRNWKTAEAAKTIEGWSLDQLNPNSDYQRAYVMAWVAMRMGDMQKATDAMLWAVDNWKGRTTKGYALQEMMLFMSRAGMPLDKVMPVFVKQSNNEPGTQYQWLYKLYEGYEFNGYRELAPAALAKALETLGDKVPPTDRMSILFRQFQNYLVGHQPELAAATLIKAYESINTCGQPCAGNKDQMAGQIKNLAPHFHTTFATTQDERFYGPAEQLYNFYIGLQLADAAQYQSHLVGLQDTKKRMLPNAGLHDKVTLGWSTSVRNNALKACYESVLQREPQLAGEVKVTLEIGADGKVVGASTEPGAGAEGLAAVGTCIQERARVWTFPSRTKPGKTTVTRTFGFSPKQG